MEWLQLHLIGVGGGSTHLAVLRGLAEVPLSAVAPRLVEAALVVRRLAKGAGLLFVGSACKLRSAFVPTGLLKDEPDVSSPEHEVEKSENLKRRRQNYSAHKCLAQESKLYCKSKQLNKYRCAQFVYVPQRY